MQVLYSKAKEQVEQGRYIFEILWKNAIPASQRLAEIENNIQRRETLVMTDPTEIFQMIVSHIESARGISIITDYGGLELAYNKFFDILKKAVIRSEAGGQSIRWIIKIDKGNAKLVKTFLTAGIKIRHAKDLAPINFAVSDFRVNATVDKISKGEIMPSMLTSTDAAYVSHFSAVFEEIWRRGVDAEERIREIARGIEPADLVIMQDPIDIIKKIAKAMRNAKEEILVLLPTENSLKRVLNIDNGATFKALLERKDHRPVLRFLVRTQEDSQTVKKAQELIPRAQFMILNSDLNSLLTIIVIDQKECMTIEIKDDGAVASEQAIGTTIYSDSRSFVASYHTILRSLWNEKLLSDEIKTSKQKQQDFINVAAHDLRNPIQPILTVSQILCSRIRSAERENNVRKTTKNASVLERSRREKIRQRRNNMLNPYASKITNAALCDVIYRNTLRLKNLSDNILDLARMDGQGLKLNYETFDLEKSISSAIANARLNVQASGKRIRIKCTHARTRIYADRTRIMQVINNLLDNAVKFTECGTIEIVTCESAKGITVKVKDSGSGIDPIILPRIFQKFVTTATDGAGLGLFICDKIITAHKGKIWAYSNSKCQGTDGRLGRKNSSIHGTTFAFFIPRSLEIDRAKSTRIRNST